MGPQPLERAARATNLFQVFHGIVYVWPIEAGPENLGATETERGYDVALDLQHVYFIHFKTSSATLATIIESAIVVEHAPHSPCPIVSMSILSYIAAAGRGLSRMNWS